MSEIGTTAPDFTLTGTQGDEIREFTLSEFADGRPLLLLFYVYDFSPVCSDQMCEVNDMEMLTLNDDIGVLGISTDGPYSHQQFIEQNGISYPLLSDDDKRLYEQFGMLEESVDGQRNHKRGLVLLDADLTVRHTWVANDNWDPWSTAPLEEAYDIAMDLI